MMNNYDEEDYLQSSSDSETSSIRILLDDNVSVQNHIEEEETIFKMENLSGSASESIKSFIPEENHYDNCEQLPPASPPYSPSPKDNASVMVRSSNNPVMLEDFMLLSRSLGAFEMGESFHPSYTKSFGTSLPDDILTRRVYKSFIENKLTPDKSKESKIETFFPKGTPLLNGCLNYESQLNEVQAESLPVPTYDEISLQEEKEEVDAKISSKDEEEVAGEPSVAKEKDIYKESLVQQEGVHNEHYTKVETSYHEKKSDKESSAKKTPASNLSPKEDDGESTIATDELTTKTPKSYAPSSSTASILESDMSGTEENSVNKNTFQVESSSPVMDTSNQQAITTTTADSSISRDGLTKFSFKRRPRKTSNRKQGKQVSRQAYKKAAVMKVVGLDFNTIFKDLQRHFYDPSVLNIRYLRPLNTAYITFRNHLSMSNVIFRLDGTYLNGMMLSCIPSSSKEMAYVSNMPVKYKSEAYPNHAVHGFVDFRNDTVVPYVLHYTPIPPCYERFFIVKPKFIKEVEFSFTHNYWYVNARYCEYLNRLFENTQSVYFIFSITGSRALQGYTRMKSHAVNIKTATRNELQGTPFSADREIKFNANGKVWQYICRVEWLVRGHVTLESLSSLKNPWSNNSMVKTSTDFTQLDPEVGRFILEKFHI